MDLRVKGSPKYTEQSLKLKLNLYKARTLIIENDFEDALTAPANTLYKLSGVGGKELSNLQHSFQDGVDLFRDYPGLGVDLSFDEIFQLEQLIEREESLKKLINQKYPTSADTIRYEQILAVLVEEFNEKYETKDDDDPNNDQNRDRFKGESMPKVITHLELGQGAFGKAILCTKADRNEKFNLERDVVKDQATGGILNRYYVVKYIKKHHNRVEVYKNLLDYEAYLSVWMRHPNVVQVLGCYDSLDYRKYIMEFLPFTDILYRVFKTYTVDDLCLITAQIVMALEYIHDIGFVFADLHTGNVCMDYRGYIKLIDFGLAIPKDEVVKIGIHVHVKNLDSNNMCITNKDFRYCFDVHRLGILVSDLMESRRFNRNAATCVTYDEIENFASEIQYKPGDVVQYFLPTMRESRRHSIFKNIDFKRLLLREYDMTSAYSTPLSELFASNLHQSLSSSRKNTLRGDETRFSRYRKLDDPKYTSQYADLQLPKNLK